MACRRFDADGSGSISQKEVTQALRCLGVPVRKAHPSALGVHEHRPAYAHSPFALRVLAQHPLVPKPPQV